MRIIHFEDEWPRVRSIAHWLHDRVFQSLPPAEAIDLDLREEENLKSEIPAKIIVSLKSRSDTRMIFEYLFVTELDTLKELVCKDDIVVVDIMRSDHNGHFVSVLDLVAPILEQGGFIRDNWRYYSAYPEKVPECSDLKGFTKKQDKELVEFLLDKISKGWVRL